MKKGTASTQATSKSFQRRFQCSVHLHNKEIAYWISSVAEYTVQVITKKLLYVLQFTSIFYNLCSKFKQTLICSTW